MTEFIHSIEARHLIAGGGVLRDLNWSPLIGQCSVVTGEPSSGKTLLLRLLAGLERPLSGDIFYNDQGLAHMDFEGFLKFRLQTAFCFENGGHLSNRNIRENIALPLLYHRVMPREKIDALIDDYARRFSIIDKLKLPPEFVSFGVQKTAALIRCLIWNPRILFLDEPAEHIGSKNLKVLIDILQALWRRPDPITIIATSYDLSWARSFKPVIYRLNAHRLEAAA